MGKSLLKQFSKGSRETGEWLRRSRVNLLSTEGFSTLARSVDCASTSPAGSTEAPVAPKSLKIATLENAGSVLI